jgi:hypothetical protein
MGNLSLAETQALAELAHVLYSFLPGSGAIYTWREAAHEHDLQQFWIGGSKLPAITQLLEATYGYRRASFCGLLLTAVREGMKYRIKKQEPVTRQEIEKINALLLRLRFKIPELHDQQFLDGLRSSGKPSLAPATLGTQAEVPMPAETIDQLRSQFLTLFGESDPKARGFKFEAFLNDLFYEHRLAPRASFRVVGEQIDGSFEWQGSVFLVEARWRAEPASASDMLVLRGKAEKSDWTRGLFISINGFSDLASETLRIGRKANLIAMSGQDLALILEKHWTLFEALRVKLRHTGETGGAYLPLIDLRK